MLSDSMKKVEEKKTMSQGLKEGLLLDEQHSKIHKMSINKFTTGFGMKRVCELHEILICTLWV